jgi:hypothetical protein
MIWRWVVVTCLVGLAVWSGYLAAFNYWAAGGPPTPHPEYFRHWGNIFFAAACGLLALSVAMVVANLRGVKRGQQRPPENPSVQPQR